jgi:hypothetical protein
MFRNSLYGLVALAILATAAIAVPRAIAMPGEGATRPVALDQHERHPNFKWSDPVASAGPAALDLHERHPDFRWADSTGSSALAALDLHERHPNFHWSEE